MALNIVDLIESIPLSYGLDFRVDRYNVTESATVQIMAVDNNVSTTESIVDYEHITYYFGTTAETMDISSSNNSDTMQVTVYYYSSTSDTEPSTQSVTLSGQTPVTLSSDIFRISKMIISSSASSLNAGTVYLYKNGTSVTNGVPSSNIVALMAPNIGCSRQSYMYVPAGWNAYLISVNLVNNAVSGNEIRVKEYHMVSPSSSFLYQVNDITLNNSSYHYDENLAPAIPENSTYVVKSSKSNVLTTATLTVLYHFVLLR